MKKEDRKYFKQVIEALRMPGPCGSAYAAQRIEDLVAENERFRALTRELVEVLTEAHDKIGDVLAQKGFDQGLADVRISILYAVGGAKRVTE